MPPSDNQMELFKDVPNSEGQVNDNVTEEDREAIVEFSEGENGEVKAQVHVSNEDDDSSSFQNKGEHEEYSHKVKKRIDKITAKLREAERQREAALLYANSVQQQLVTSQQRVSSLDHGYLAESEGRIQSQLAIVEANLQDAVERSDGKAVVEAQKLLSQLVLQQEKLKNAKTQLATQRVQAQQQVQQPVQQPVQQRAAPDPKAESWAEENEWFGTDQIMTNAAFSIHGQLQEEGFDLSSDEYYDELNSRIREAFPHKFGRAQASRTNVPSVAPATRGIATTSGRRQVKLTPSEVSMARRIGVPLEEYAKYVRR
jgi:hypothetical protein